MNSDKASKLSHRAGRTKDIVCSQKAFIVQEVVPIIKKQNDAGVQNDVGVRHILVYQATQAVVVAAKTRTRPDGMTLAGR